MKTSPALLKQIEKEFDKEFGIPEAYLEGTLSVKPEHVKSFYRTALSTLLQQVGEEGSEKKKYRCGKCEQEEKYPNAEPIPEHFRTCPKNVLKNAYMDEEIMGDWENQLLLSFKSMESGLSGSQVNWIVVFIKNIIHYKHEKAYEDAAKRFRMREEEVRNIILDKIEEKLKTYDYYCEDPDCCYSDVVEGVRRLVDEQRSRLDSVINKIKGI